MSTSALFPFPIVDLLGNSSPSAHDSVRKIIWDTAKHLEFPATRQKKQHALDAVFEAYVRSRAGIDSEAVPISEMTYNETISFLRALPSSLPIPEVVTEPDGDLALEWYVSNYRSFVIGFSGIGVLSYSGLFGRGHKTYGTEFVSESIPRVIVENIRRAYS